METATSINFLWVQNWLGWLLKQNNMKLSGRSQLFHSSASHYQAYHLCHRERNILGRMSSNNFGYIRWVQGSNFLVNWLWMWTKAFLCSANSFLCIHWPHGEIHSPHMRTTLVRCKWYSQVVIQARVYYESKRVSYYVLPCTNTLWRVLKSTYAIVHRTYCKCLGW